VYHGAFEHLVCPYHIGRMNSSFVGTRGGGGDHEELVCPYQGGFEHLVCSYHGSFKQLVCSHQGEFKHIVELFQFVCLFVVFFYK